EECPGHLVRHSPCLREVNVPYGRRSSLPSTDTVVCQERVTRHLAFCPTPAPATIRYGIPLVRTANPATLRPWVTVRWRTGGSHRPARTGPRERRCEPPGLPLALKE